MRGHAAGIPGKSGHSVDRQPVPGPETRTAGDFRLSFALHEPATLTPERIVGKRDPASGIAFDGSGSRKGNGKTRLAGCGSGNDCRVGNPGAIGRSAQSTLRLQSFRSLGALHARPHGPRAKMRSRRCPTAPAPSTEHREFESGVAAPGTLVFDEERIDQASLQALPRSLHGPATWQRESGEACR